MRSQDASWHGMSSARNAQRPLSDARRRQYRPSYPGGLGKIAAVALETRAVFFRGPMAMLLMFKDVSPLLVSCTGRVVLLFTAWVPKLSLVGLNCATGSITFPIRPTCCGLPTVLSAQMCSLTPGLKLSHFR